MKRILALSISLLLLAGCGGGGGGSSSTPGTPGAPAKGSTQAGSVVIFIPNGTGQSGSSKVRYPQFVSPNASSVAMNINGGADTLFDVSSGSSLCTTVGGGRNCTLAFSAPVGGDTFGFLIFAGANGTGTQLASAVTKQTIASGQAFNFIVALNAAVGTIVINFALVTHGGGGNCPDGPNSFNGINEGCAGSAPITVNVDDPSGAQITGTAPYATPISISGNDPALSASPNQFTAPGQSVTLSYTGAPFAATITNQAVVTLTAGGQSAQLSLPILRQYLYVANSNAPFGTTPTCCGNISVYTYGASGAAPPVRTITSVTAPIKPLVDTSGTLYVLDNGLPLSGAFNPTISVFAPGVTGNATPIRQITGLGALSTNQPCADIIFDPTGAFLFVSCANKVFVFPVGANTTATSATVASFPVGSLSAGLAFDQSGNLYVADSGADSIFIVSAPVPTSGGAQTVAGGSSMDGAPTGSAWPAGVAPFFIAVDNSGALFAPVWYQNSTPGGPDAQAELAMWKGANVCNNCVPNSTLTGSPFASHAVDGVVLDSAGNVYVDNLFTNLVTEFSQATVAGASLNTVGAVLRTLTNTGPPGSAGMAIGP